MTTLTPEAVRAIANVLVFAATKKDAQMTPILGGVAVRVEDDTLTAVSTDRYMVGRAIVTLPHDGNMPQTMLPAEFVVALSKTTGTVELEVSEPAGSGDAAHRPFGTVTLTATHSGGTIMGTAIPGNIPPVGRLIPELDAIAELDGNPVLDIAKLAKVAKLKHSRNTPMTWRFGTVAPTTRDSARTGCEPVVMTFPEYDSTSYVVMLQPSIPLR